MSRMEGSSTVGSNKDGRNADDTRAERSLRVLDFLLRLLLLRSRSCALPVVRLLWSILAGRLLHVLRTVVGTKPECKRVWFSGRYWGQCRQTVNVDQTLQLTPSCRRSSRPLRRSKVMRRALGTGSIATSPQLQGGQLRRGNTLRLLVVRRHGSSLFVRSSRGRQ
jgi:hypothetical protein